MALGKLDRADARLKRRAARQQSSGLTPEQFQSQLRATKRAKKAARKKECAPFQKRLNAYHAAWVAAGMPTGFPNMDAWEVSSQLSRPQSARGE